MACNSCPTGTGQQDPAWLQRRRSWFQGGFFLLFILAPPLDLFRYDLTAGHFYFLGMHWTLGIDALESGQISPLHVAFNIMVRGFLPLALVGGGLIWTAWRFGRLYCAWLCPHFSVVEAINKLMFRASGRSPRLPMGNAANGRLSPETS